MVVLGRCWCQNLVKCIHWCQRVYMFSATSRAQHLHGVTCLVKDRIHGFLAFAKSLRSRRDLSDSIFNVGESRLISEI